jgi:hypothetical protein
MATYIICYDLIAKKDYESLYTAIKTFNKWARVLESTWIITSEKSCTEVRDFLVGYMDSDDKLFVTKSSGVGAWKNVRCSNDWLKKNL